MIDFIEHSCVSPSHTHLPQLYLAAELGALHTVLAENGELVDRMQQVIFDRGA